jgi:protein CrcB
MKQALIVGLGGFIGSVGRYKLGGVILHHSAAWRFPLSTFAVNVIGCFVIGALAGLVEHRDLFSPETRLFLFTGFWADSRLFQPLAMKECSCSDAGKSQSRLPMPDHPRGNRFAAELRAVREDVGVGKGE